MYYVLGAYENLSVGEYYLSLCGTFEKQEHAVDFAGEWMAEKCGAATSTEYREVISRSCEKVCVDGYWRVQVENAAKPYFEPIKRDGQGGEAAGTEARVQQLSIEELRSVVLETAKVLWLYGCDWEPNFRANEKFCIGFIEQILAKAGLRPQPKPAAKPPSLTDKVRQDLADHAAGVQQRRRDEAELKVRLMKDAEPLTAELAEALAVFNDVRVCNPEKYDGLLRINVLRTDPWQGMPGNQSWRVSNYVQFHVSCKGGSMSSGLVNFKVEASESGVSITENGNVYSVEEAVWETARRVKEILVVPYVA